MNDLITADIITKSRNRWHGLANDIALSSIQGSVGTSVTTELLCDHYNLTDSELAALFQVKEFQKMVKDAIAYLKDLGPNAAMIQQCRLLAGEVQENIYKRIVSAQVDPKDMIKFYELLMKYALLDPTTNGTNKKEDNKPTVAVQINLPQQVRGLNGFSAEEVEGDVYERSIPV